MEQGSLAEKLRVLRARRGLSLLAASKQLGIDRHTLRRVELGVQEPQYPTLAKIAEGYDVPVEELLEEPVGAGKDEAPLSPEWALSTPDEAFRRSVEGASTEELRGLIVELVAGEHPRLFEDERTEKPPADVLYRRSASFARALVVREELLRRGEEPPENQVLALRRYMNALELTEDPALGRYKAEAIFAPDQVAAFLAQDERDNERIKAELAKLSPEDVSALVAASPVLSKLSEAFRKGQERRDRGKPEAC